MEIKIIKMGINGEGIGYIKKRPVFVAGAFPQEVVEAKIISEYKTYRTASCEKILTRSPYRVKPVCFNHRCKACPLIGMDYDQQLVLKKGLLEEALLKYAGIRGKTVTEVRPNPQPLGYRNSLKLPVKSIQHELYTGMYEPRSNHFTTISNCVIHEPGLENMRREILQVLNKHRIESYDPKTRKGLRFLVLRGFADKYQCTLVTGDDELSDRLCDDLAKLPGLVSLNQSVNLSRMTYEIFGSRLKCLRGDQYITARLADFDYRLSPTAFFQLNRYQAENIYNYVASQVKPGELIVDAYCGIGSMTLFLKDKGKRIIGIENLREAVKDARVNAKMNRVDNCEFMVDDAAAALKKIAKQGRIDSLVLNPPRSGLDDAMIDSIQHSRPAQLIYVSCNQSTLAKNLNILKADYKIGAIVPFDMFSYTPLIETVVTMELKGHKA